MTYQEVLNLYGSDKPDIRFDRRKLLILNLLLLESEFQAFKGAEMVRGIIVKDGVNLSRKDIDGLTEFVKL